MREACLWENCKKIVGGWDPERFHQYCIDSHRVCTSDKIETFPTWGVTATSVVSNIMHLIIATTSWPNVFLSLVALPLPLVNNDRSLRTALATCLSGAYRPFLAGSSFKKDFIGKLKKTRCKVIQVFMCTPNARQSQNFREFQQKVFLKRLKRMKCLMGIKYRSIATIRIFRNGLMPLWLKMNSTLKVTIQDSF